jgi:predicted permease
MQVILIVAPVFALIAIGYLASLSRLLSEAAHKGISEFTFGIAMPALLFRTIGLTDIPAQEPFRLWGAYFGAAAVVWLAATLLTASVLRRPAADAAPIAMSSVYGNVVMLGIPLALASFGSEAAAPMALILAINTPLLWIAGTLHMAWAERKAGTSLARLMLSILVDLGRNPIILAIVAGSLWRLGGLGLHPLADRVLALLGQSGVPCALVALGAGLTQFQIRGQAPTLTALLALKLIALPAVAWVLAYHVFLLPPVAAAVVVLFSAMPTGANAYLFATRYNRVVNSTSGAAALGTILAAITAAALVSALVAPGAN